MSEQPPNPEQPEQPEQPQQPQYGQPYPQTPPPPPAWQPPPGQPYAYQPPPPAPGSATTALILGIVGVVMCPLVASIPAWIIGRNSVREIDASQGQLGGRSTAQAGYVLGIIGTALGALGILAFLGIFAIGAMVTNELDDCSQTGTTESFTIEC